MKTIRVFLLIAGILVFYGCKKDKGDLSTVETFTPEYISSTSATIGCNISADGGSGIASCGVYLSLQADAQITGVQLQMGNSTGIFLGRVTGLVAGTQYFMKAYAINDKGEAFGEEVNFTTPATVKDYDNNVYGTVKIGSQQWMAENLRTASYLNGDAISTTNPVSLNISSETAPKYQWSYNGSDANGQTYGKLYTWYAITDTRKICPTGWHIPTDAEWTTLENKLGTYVVAGNSLKEAGNTHWIAPYNIEANNESCFTALPGGYRDSNGTFYLLQNDAYFGSSTESEAAKSWTRNLNSSNPSVGRISVSKNWGVSVRCVKD
jgi:uncharacterized protein (TIGR02145 family)